MKAIWSGSLSFGLVHIPLRVYPAAEDHVLPFHMLHKKDHSPIRFSRICEEEEVEVPYSDIVKAYEYAKGEYVVLETQDFKNANAKKTGTIAIVQFVDVKEIAPFYFEKPYFLEPDKKAAKAYQLLNEALMQSKKVAIASFVFREKEHIGAVMGSKEGLVLIQMRYSNQMRSAKQLDLPKGKVTAQELEMALSLINQLSSPFKPEKFHDTYTEELMGFIEQKLKGKKQKRPKQAKKVSMGKADLMHVLKVSLEKSLQEKTIPTSKRPASKKSFPKPKESKNKTRRK